MEGKQLIAQLALRNFLSYGHEGVPIDLLPLNVLIGANGSGKSNLIEALALLRSTPTDLTAAIREGGGIAEYLHKHSESDLRASISVNVIHPRLSSDLQPLTYLLEVTRSANRVEISEEMLGAGAEHAKPVLYYHFDGANAIIARNGPMEGPDRLERVILLEDLVPGQSIFAQRRDPDEYPELTWLGDQFGSISIFREWTFGQRSRVRLPEAADMPSDFLLPDSSNLALVLHDLQQRAPTRKKLIEYLQRFYSSAQHIATRISAGTVQLYIDEGLDDLVPATRLSDGTLRYLSLLAILLHPSPPPLVCIEEPEMGLHPDILPTIGELLIDASQRTQLVVTTHSDALVSALSDVPESIVVCEPGENGSQLRRLDRDALAEWLNRYSLGEMWRMGEIGGTRW